jgi:hypothetical protein
MKLIIEQTFDNLEYVSESKDNEKKLYIKGIFLQSEIKNRNNRIYRKPILEREVKRYNTQYIKENTAWGELSHPKHPEVNPDRISHIITDLKEDGNNYIGKALITNTPKGNLVRGLIESGGKIGVSSRGLGSLKSTKKQVNEVGDDYHLCCVDIVTDPSAPEAFVDGIMEGKEWVMESGVFKESEIVELQESIKNAGFNIHESKLAVYQQFLYKLRKS